MKYLRRLLHHNFIKLSKIKAWRTIRQKIWKSSIICHAVKNHVIYPDNVPYLNWHQGKNFENVFFVIHTNLSFKNMSANFNYHFYNKNVRKCFLLFYDDIYVFLNFSVMGNRWNKISPYILRIQFLKILKNNISFTMLLCLYLLKITVKQGKWSIFTFSNVLRAIGLKILSKMH